MYVFDFLIACWQFTWYAIEISIVLQLNFIIVTRSGESFEKYLTDGKPTWKTKGHQQSLSCYMWVKVELISWQVPVLFSN